MDSSAAAGLATLGMAGTLLLFVLAILWLLVPFAIFGIKPLLRNLIAEQRKTQDLLSAFGKELKDKNTGLSRDPV